MSIQLGSLVSHILYDHFGEIVQKVGSDLCRFGGKPIPLIIKTTSLPRTQIVQALRSLIKYGLVAFEPSKNETVADYRLIKENVLCLLRYPKYLFLIKNKFGFESELIVEEILQQGSITVSQLIINIVLKTKNDKERNVTPTSLRDCLISLVTAGYINQSLSPTEESIEADVPIFIPTEANNQMLPEVDIRAITLFINGEEKAEIKAALHWRCNLDRFHQDFRDELMVTAMTRCIDECGGELMRQLLQQMYLRTDPWAVSSNPIPFVELKDYCKRTSADNPLLLQYLEQYLKVMEDSTSGVISCTGSAGGGQYTLNAARAVELMLWDMICSTVQERLGTKAARIFRLIKSKKFIEEEDIQRNAMLPAKEAKQLTYKLLEEHFIEVQVLRKNASGIAGPSKAFYLYHIDLNHVANMALELTYKALYNAVTRREHERYTNKRMIEKQQRVDTIVHGMRMRGEPDENITDIEETVTPPEKVVLERIKQMIKKLSSAEIQLDETMFLLQTYFTYRNKK